MDHLIESEYQQVIVFWFCVWINKNNNETKVFIIQLTKIEPFLFQTVTIVDHGFKLNKQKGKKRVFHFRWFSIDKLYNNFLKNLNY